MDLSAFGSRFPEARLCANCQHIDFDKLVKSAKRVGKSKVSVNLSDVGNSDCDLCTVLLKMKSAYDFTWKYPEEWALVAIQPPSGELFYEPMLAFVPDLKLGIGIRSFLQVQSSHPPCCSSQAPRIDWNLVKHLLTMCKRKHERCKKTGAMVPNLRLIPCNQMNQFLEKPPIIATNDPNISYLALSYLWGDESSNKTRPSMVPQTIRDAIYATIALGYEYLWVDRYCIPQDSATKHDMIRNMHRIYENAELTIIAVAGADPHYGLPGISRDRVSRPQFTVETYNMKYVDLRSCSDAILESKWNTRGWTYQEGLLSRRKLAFTDQSTYFQCTIDFLHEEGSLLCSDIDRWTFQYDPKGGILVDLPIEFPDVHWEYHPFDIERLISQYCDRVLTFESDTFNAFQGIFQKFKELYVMNLYGLPIYPASWHLEPDSMQGRLICSLSWHFTERSVICRRSPNFPSWTWLGWRFSNRQWGRFTPALRDGTYSEIRFGTQIESIQIEFENKVRKNPECDDDINFNDPTNLPKYLIIQGPVVDLEMVEVRVADYRVVPVSGRGSLLDPSELAAAIPAYQLRPRNGSRADYKLWQEMPYFQYPSIEEAKKLRFVGLILSYSVGDFAALTALFLSTSKTNLSIPAYDDSQIYERIGVGRVPKELPDNFSPLYGKLDLYEEWKSKGEHRYVRIG